MKKSFRSKPATQGDIDTVVAVVTKGFEEVNKNIAAVSQKVEVLDKKVQVLDTKVQEIDRTLLDVKRRVYDLEADSAGRKQVLDHEHRIKKLETHVFTSV